MLKAYKGKPNFGLAAIWSSVCYIAFRVPDVSARQRIYEKHAASGLPAYAP